MGQEEIHCVIGQKKLRSLYPQGKSGVKNRKILTPPPPPPPAQKKKKKKKKEEEKVPQQKIAVSLQHFFWSAVQSGDHDMTVLSILSYPGTILEILLH